MEIRKTLSAIVGIAQSLTGIMSAILTALIFLDIVEIQKILNVPPEFLPLYLLILGLFSFFSIISGVFLTRELRS